MISACFLLIKVKNDTGFSVFLEAPTFSLEASQDPQCNVLSCYCWIVCGGVGSDIGPGRSTVYVYRVDISSLLIYVILSPEVSELAGPKGQALGL